HAWAATGPLLGRRAGRRTATVRRARTEPPAWPEAPSASSTLDQLLACLGAVERLDATALDAALRRAAIALSAESFLDALVVPLWTRVAANERHGMRRPARRHLTL